MLVLFQNLVALQHEINLAFGDRIGTFAETGMPDAAREISS